MSRPRNTEHVVVACRSARLWHCSFVPRHAQLVPGVLLLLWRCVSIWPSDLADDPSHATRVEHGRERPRFRAASGRWEALKSHETGWWRYSAAFERGEHVKLQSARGPRISQRRERSAFGTRMASTVSRVLQRFKGWVQTVRFVCVCVGASRFAVCCCAPTWRRGGCLGGTRGDGHAGPGRRVSDLGLDCQCSSAFPSLRPILSLAFANSPSMRGGRLDVGF